MGRTLAAEAGPDAAGTSSLGRAGRRSGGFLFPGAGLGGAKGPGGGAGPRRPLLPRRACLAVAAAAGCPRFGCLAKRALAPPSGRPGRKQEAGAACALLVSSPAALGPAFRGCCSIRRLAVGQLFSAPAGFWTRPPSQAPARGVDPASPLPPRLIVWPPLPRPQPRWLCATETPRSVFRVGVPASPLPGAGEAPGPGNHRSTPPPPSPSAQPCGPGSCASESPWSGPVACFLLGSGRCFVDFVCVSGFLRPPVFGRRGGRQPPAAAPLAPASPAPLWGSEPGERGRRVEVGRPAGCACLLPQPSPSSLREAGGLLWISGDPPKAGQGRGLACGFRAVPASRLPATPFPACLRWGPPRTLTPALGSAAARPRDCGSPRLPPPPVLVPWSGPMAPHSAALPPPPPILRGLERGSNPAPSRWLLLLVCWQWIPLPAVRIPLRDASRGRHRRGLEKWGIPACWKSC